MVKKRYIAMVLILLMVIVFFSVVRADEPPDPPPSPTEGMEEGSPGELPPVPDPEIDPTEPPTILPDDPATTTTTTIINNEAPDERVYVIHRTENVTVEKIVPAAGSTSGTSDKELANLKKDMQDVKSSLASQSDAVDRLGSDVEQFGEKADQYFSDDSDEGNGMLITLVIIGVVFVLSAVGVFLFFYFKNNSAEVQSMAGSGPVMRQSSSAVDMNSVNRIRSYVSYNLRRGYSAASLRQALLKQGYREQEINLAFRYSR